MSPIRTYLDTNVLIGAASGKIELSQRANNIITDKNRVFVSSLFSKMETLPVPMRRHDTFEENFLLTFYSLKVIDWAANLDLIINRAIALSGNTNIDIMDACHLLAATSLQADEFITAEKHTSPVLKYSALKVSTIYT